MPAQIECLPQELFDHILSLLDPEGIFNLSKCSRATQNMAIKASNRAWFNVLARCTGIVGMVPANHRYNKDCNYKRLVERKLNRETVVCEFCGMGTDISKLHKLVVDWNSSGIEKVMKYNFRYHIAICCNKCLLVHFVEFQDFLPTDVDSLGDDEAEELLMHLQDCHRTIVLRSAMELNRKTRDTLQHQWVLRKNWNKAKSQCLSTGASPSACFGKTGSFDVNHKRPFARNPGSKHNNNLLLFEPALEKLFAKEYTAIHYLVKPSLLYEEIEDDLLTFGVLNIGSDVGDFSGRGLKVPFSDIDEAFYEQLEFIEGVLKFMKAHFGLGDGTPLRLRLVEKPHILKRLVVRWYRDVYESHGFWKGEGSASRCCYCWDDLGREDTASQKVYGLEKLAYHLFDFHGHMKDEGWRFIPVNDATGST